MGGSFLPPWVLQVFGLVMLAVLMAVKILAGIESIPLMGTAVGLVTAGGVKAATQSLRQSYTKPPNGGDEP